MADKCLYMAVTDLLEEWQRAYTIFSRGGEATIINRPC